MEDNEYLDDSEDHREYYYRAPDVERKPLSRKARKLTNYLKALPQMDLVAIGAQYQETSKHVCFYDLYLDEVINAIVSKHKTIHQLKQAMGEQIERQETRKRLNEEEEKAQQDEMTRQFQETFDYLCSHRSNVVVDYNRFPKPRTMRTVLEVDKTEQKVRLSNPHHDENDWYTRYGTTLRTRTTDHRKVDINIKKTMKAQLRTAITQNRISCHPNS
jgi:hypothetical protein